MTIYDDVLKGAEGQLTIPSVEVDSMNMVDSSALTAKIEYEQKIRPTLKVQIRDTPEGDLIIRWRTS